jgi:transcriptional regulator with XRE-family HTH domain
MPAVAHWTGREARALRVALRLSVRVFAERLGIGARTVSKWEALGPNTTPRPHMQAVLDTALGQADADVKLRFELLVAEVTEVSVQRHRHPSPRSWEYESWTDDLDRALVALSGQEFAFAERLLTRWLTRFTPHDLDSKGLYLYGRTLVLHGDVQQDQGQTHGPESAQTTYRKARRVFADLDIPRRVARVELGLTVLDEMAGQLTTAAERYGQLAGDDRLSERDRVRAHLWIGTALSKAGHNTDATRFILPSIQAFEALDEPLDWSIAHQKLALAYRGAGDLGGAVRTIEVALAHRGDSPMQRVRLDTAHAHILLSDKATADEGLALLDTAGNVAQHYQLMHQYHSIQNIRDEFEAAENSRIINA